MHIFDSILIGILIIGLNGTFQTPLTVLRPVLTLFSLVFRRTYLLSQVSPPCKDLPSGLQEKNYRKFIKERRGRLVHLCSRTGRRPARTKPLITQSAEKINDFITSELLNFLSNQSPQDDLTLMVIKRIPM